MAQIIATDVTLIRGSVNLTIAGVVYSATDFKAAAKARSEKDYTTTGKYRGQSIAEDLEEITCTVRARSDQVAPPKFVAFAFTLPNSISTATNWQITEREISGSQAGIQAYALTISECPSGTVTIS
jgi:hypothetical protein